MDKERKREEGKKQKRKKNKVHSVLSKRKRGNSLYSSYHKRRIQGRMGKKR
jgi:hypothetical protein